MKDGVQCASKWLALIVVFILICAGMRTGLIRSMTSRQLSSRVISVRRHSRERHSMTQAPPHVNGNQPSHTALERVGPVVIDDTLPPIDRALLMAPNVVPTVTRTSFLQSNLSAMLSQGLCLEIGPKDIPALPASHARVRFLDYLDQASLRHKHATDTSINQATIPFIHYVWNGSISYRELTGGQRFQLIIASHVAEHVPDFVSWLRQLADILTPDGVLRLVVPDKRYCFDFRRRLSSFADVLAAYLEKRTRPSVAATYDNYARIPPKHNSARLHWSGSPRDYKLTEQIHADAYWRATRALHEADWGVHSWQWSTIARIRIQT